MTIRMNCNDTISLHQPTVDPLPTWTQWMRVGMRKMGQDVLHAATAAAAWSERHGERRRLLALDDRMLKDIGLSRADAWAEGRKPVWRQ